MYHILNLKYRSKYYELEEKIGNELKKNYFLFLHHQALPSLYKTPAR